ncbi:MAG: hypothetical protein WD401_03895 [Thermomicrobiaceae bacterium]
MSEHSAAVSRRVRQTLSSIRRFFDTGNILRFLVSMILAFGLWAWVTYENDPETTRVLGGITVSLENVERELEFEGEPPIVDVTVQGPQSIVTPMERDTIVATADMAEIDEPGEHEVEVTVEAPTDVRVRDVAPGSITVELSEVSSDASSLAQRPGAGGEVIRFHGLRL